jgi:hypothetical protein
VSHSIALVCSPGSASSGVPPASAICSGTQLPGGPDRVEPLDRGHPRPRLPGDPRAHGSQPGVQPRQFRLGPVRRVERGAELGEAVQDTRDGARFEADHPGVGVQHVPLDVTLERDLDPQLTGWFSYAWQKLAELVTLRRGLTEGRAAIAGELQVNADHRAARATSPIVNVPAVRERVA